MVHALILVFAVALLAFAAGCAVGVHAALEKESPRPEGRPTEEEKETDAK